MQFPAVNRRAVLRRPPLLQAAAAVLLTSAFILPAARAESQSPSRQSQSAAAPAQGSAAEVPLTQGEIKAQREFKMLDFNKDGKLSRSEVALFPRLAAAFDEADTDKDGFVSYEEVKAFAVKYRAERDKAKAQAEQAQAPASQPAQGASRQ